MSDRKPIKFVTPRLVFIFPKLTAPDTKYKKEGEYRVKGRCTLDAFPADIVEQLTAARDALAEATRADLTAKKQGAKAKSLKVRDIFTAETDKESGEETGFVLLSAKMTASGISKRDGKPWTRAPKLFDAAGNKLGSNKRIWGGSEGKLAVEALPYYTPKDNEVGMAFYLNAVQVLKLVSGGGDNAADHGFGAEEGYTDEDAADAGQFNDGDPGPTDADAPAPKSGDDF